MRRGSVKQGGDQARVRDWLMSHPGWHLSNAVGRGIDLDPSRVGTILSNMRRQSMTESRSVYLGGRRICEYRLTPEYEALVRGGGADAAPTEAEASAEPAAVPVPVAADPIPAPEGDPIPEPTSAPDLEIAAAAPPMRCALWSDGMLDLVFADRGERVTLGREHAAVLIAYIRGLPTPAGEGACA